MNETPSPHGTQDLIARTLKLAAIVCTVGFVTLIANHAIVSTHDGAAAIRLLATPPEAVAPPGGYERDYVSPAAASAARSEAAMAAPFARYYPEPSADAVGDEDGHPSSF